MKISAIIRIIIPVFFLYLWACQPDAENILEMDTTEQEVENYLQDAEERFILLNQRIPEDISTCSTTPTEIPLIGWPGVEMGMFSIDNNEEYLIAHFELDPANSWYLKQTKLLVVISELKDTPGRSFTKYKKYLYPVNHEKGTMSFTYQIPFSDLKLDQANIEKCISISGIARLDNGKYKLGKFAIAENRDTGKRHYWKSWLHEYCLAECVSPDIFDCGIAWMEGLEYSYGLGELGLYDIFHSELVNKIVVLSVTDLLSGQKIEVGQVEILFWGASSDYDLFIEFQPYDGYDVQDAKIYVGILEPMREPDNFKNQITFPDQSSLVFKMKTDYEPIYLSIAATVCSE
jgi:hypothetical protein